jgi:hypothetical protein
MKLRTWVIVAGVLFSASAHAYRPFDGTDADVAETGHIELEIGPLGYLRAQHDSALVFGNGVFNFGFIPRWELVIAGQGVYGLDAMTPPPRFQNGSVFLKHTLREGTLQGEHGISLALEFGVLFPTSDAPFVDAGLHACLIASYAWPHFVMHVNTWIERGVDGQTDLFLGTIFEGHQNARIRPVAEIFLDRHGSDVQPSVLVGAILTVNDHLSFDAATRLAYVPSTSVGGGASLFEVRAGLTWTIVAFRPHNR